MNFLFNMLNHNKMGQRSLEDVIGIMGQQLNALGHRAVWNPANDKFLHASQGVNIIVEGFTPAVVDKLRIGHAQGGKFICLATEEPSDKGFNQGTQPEMVMRQRTFIDAAPYLSGILHLVPGQHVTDWYSQHAPAAYAELGYAKALVRLSTPFDKEPEFDFGFYGSMSKRRLGLLKQLAKRTGGTVKIVADFKTQQERDAEMRRCRVILQIRKFEEMGLVSSSRCCTALLIGRPVVAEPHLLSKPWDEVVTFTNSLDHFMNTANIMRGAWRGVHAKQFDIFRAKMTPEFCIGEPMRKIGVLP